MVFIKKNLAFTIVVVACLLAFAVGAFLAFAEFGQIDEAKQKISSAETRLNGILSADPAPTPENVEASQENVAELKNELKQIRENLERGSRLTTTTDGIDVMTGIQQHISEYRRKAAENTDEEGDSYPILLPQDFAFGFERYLEGTRPLDDPELIPVLDKQRQILGYLLNKLFEANPESMVSVQREVVEAGEQSNRGGRSFKISPAVSARVPGAINTLAFSLSFTGYTESLREFLNNLSNFDLPIVVRSIAVTRSSGQTTVVEAPETNNFDSLFGGDFGGESGSGEEAPAETKELVISEITSTFTVVLEFIEIVLPAETAEENV